jgi:fatty acid desaturase
VKTIWKYSTGDAVLFSIAVFQLLGMTLWALNFETLPTLVNLGLILIMGLIFYFNPIVITHNFLHCPFFKRRPWNRLFAILNSGNLFLPQVLYKHHHLIHHAYSNDPYQEDCAHGHTMDPSSTFRHGKNGAHEHFIPYCALSLFRDATNYSFRRTLDRGDGSQLVFELLAIGVTGTVWFFISWKWFLLAFLPTFLIGWFLAAMENYFEHFRASSPENRFANSVSFYHPLYNRIMFNEGYHQAHHIKPGRHWTERPDVKIRYAEKMGTADSYIAKYPPLLGFLD